MRLITRFELATKTDKELHTLLRILFNALASDYGVHRSNTIASIQNIQNELTSRDLHPLAAMKRPNLKK